MRPLGLSSQKNARIAAVKVRIVLLPNEQFDKLARKYSSAIADKYQVYFGLDDTHLPHPTIISSEFPNGRLEVIIDLLRNLSSRTRKMKANIDGLKHNYENFIGVYFKNTSEFKGLQSEVTNLVEPHTDSIVPAETYHLTLARLKSENDVYNATNIAKRLSANDCVFNRLAICEDGEHGTCKNAVAEFPLEA